MRASLVVLACVGVFGCDVQRTFDITSYACGSGGPCSPDAASPADARADVDLHPDAAARDAGALADAAPASDDAMPTFDDAMPTFDDAMPAFDDAMPAFDDAMPAFDDAMPAFDDAMPTFADAAPALADAAPGLPDALPTRPDAAPVGDGGCQPVAPMFACPTQAPSPDAGAPNGCVDLDLDDAFAIDPSCPQGEDCDDRNPLVRPLGVELPGDGLDNTCASVCDDLHPSDSTGIFVAKIGHDANPGTTSSPVLTIARAIALAAPLRRPVFIGEGSYVEDVVTDVSLFGGYDPLTWSRTPGTHTTTIAATGARPAAVTVNNSAALERLTILGRDAAGQFVQCFGVLGGLGLLVVKDSRIVGGARCSSTTGVLFNGGSGVLIGSTVTPGTGHSGQAFGVRNIAPTREVYIIDNHLDSGDASQGSAISLGGGRSGGFLHKIIGNRISAGGTGTLMRGVALSGDTRTLIANNVFDSRLPSTAIRVGGVELFDAPAATPNEAMVVGNTFAGLHRGLYVLGGNTATAVNNIILGTTDVVEVNDTSAPTMVTLFNNLLVLDMAGACTLRDVNGCQTLATVNACMFRGCISAGSNTTGNPRFVSRATHDLHIGAMSAARGAGVDPLAFAPYALLMSDRDGQCRPDGAWDVGADEVP